MLFVVTVAISFAPARAQSIAFTNVRIVDGNGGAPIERGAIVVQGKRIVAIGPGASVTVPSSARHIDGAGRTAIPGLADMHVHLTGGWDGETSNMLSFHRYLNSLLYSGVTTVLDTGNVEPFILQLRAETAAGRLLGPRIYCVGPLVDGPEPFWPPLSVGVFSAEQVPGLVKHLADEHVDLIKLYARLSDQMIADISAEAKKSGIRTIVDAHGRNGSMEVMAEGISGWAHFPAHRLSADAVAAAKQHGIFFLSTLSVYESFSYRRFENPAFLDEALIAATTPPRELAEIRAFGSHAATPQQQKGRAAWLEMLQGAGANVRLLRDAGILFAAGTDAPYPGVFYGEGIHRELELLVEAGLTPLEAIGTATRNAAVILNAQKDWGTLEAGKMADIILVDGKPDVTIADSKKISLVVKEGVVLDRDKLKFDPATDPGYRPAGSQLAQ